MPSASSARLIAVLMLFPVPLGSGAAAQGLQPLEYTFSDGTVIRFSGQINMGVLHYDDGQDDFTNFVDNENSSSRARLQLFSTIGDWKFESTVEAEYQPLASNAVSQFNDEPDWDFHSSYLRKAEVALANEHFGKLWLGQGSMASDGVAEVDNSGTTVVAYSSIADTAGGYFFRFEDDGLSDVTVGSAFSNFDGLGRKLRVRYDTPTFHGFGLRTSYGEDAIADLDDALYDVAATYAHESDQFDFDAAVGFARNEGTETDLLSGSASALHKPTGISLTVAAGREYSDNVEGRYGYAKLGYQRDFFEIGKTAFSIDYYYGNDIAAADSTSSSVGLAAVQNIDHLNMQLWMLYRNHHYSDPDGGYDDGQALFGGALVRF